MCMWNALFSGPNFRHRGDIPLFLHEVSLMVFRRISPSPARPFNPSLDELERHKNARCEAVIARLRAKRPRLPEQLPEDELREVEKYKKIKGHVSSTGKEKVFSEHLERLYLPGSKGWLNDEVINFYGQLIMDRSALPKFPAVHYFSSFFWTKLTEDGYEKGRLNRWTKKVQNLTVQLRLW